LGLTVKNSKLMLSTAVAVSTILGIGAASAADLAMKAMPYAAPVRVFSWTGCYVGVLLALARCVTLLALACRRW